MTRPYFSLAAVSTKRSLSISSAQMVLKRRRLSLLDGSKTVYCTEPDPKRVRVQDQSSFLFSDPVSRALLQLFRPIPILATSLPLRTYWQPTKPCSLRCWISRRSTNICFSDHVAGESLH